MDLGMLGQVRFIRKYRWTITAELPLFKIPETFIRLSKRPIEDAGGITSTFYDVIDIFSKIKGFETLGLSSTGLVLDKSKYNKTNNYWLKKNQSKFYGTVDLKLYDGCGVMMETWHLDGAYVKGVAFSELDHSSNDSDYIEMEWGYNSVKYIPAIERDLASLKMQIIAKNPTITGFAIPSTNT